MSKDKNERNWRGAASGTGTKRPYPALQGTRGRGATRSRGGSAGTWWFGCLVAAWAGLVSASAPAAIANYSVRGVLKGVEPQAQQVVVAHEEIPNFMGAMTMPFSTREALTNLAAGDRIRFQLHVTENESWVDHIERLNSSPSPYVDVPASSKEAPGPHPKNSSATAGPPRNPLPDYPFTNELGESVSLSDFRGQAIALTFFFTRCPIPEFCPRLSRNFEAVQQKLLAMENAPTNWHLLSVTFDPDHDTPEVLARYGAAYGYEPGHWSFLTGPKEKIAELARACDVQFAPDQGSFNHNFRTLIIDASNRLQMVFPTSGDISESIVRELLKAAGGSSALAEPSKTSREKATVSNNVRKERLQP